MRWISVREGLPPDDRTVLCVNEILESHTPALCYFDEEIHGFIPILNAQSYPVVVTHWMEIPEFPGGE